MGIQTRKPGSAAAELVETLLIDFAGVIEARRPLIQACIDEFEREVAESDALRRQRSEEAAAELQRSLTEQRGPRINPFPPSVSFGSGEGEIRVGPTVGGTDNPDAHASAGIQVDFNPAGAGRKPRAQFTAGLDVDRTGKVRGASAGWKCEF